jgi:hypothetical protein
MSQVAARISDLKTENFALFFILIFQPPSALLVELRSKVKQCLFGGLTKAA